MVLFSLSASKYISFEACIQASYCKYSFYERNYRLAEVYNIDKPLKLLFFVSNQHKQAHTQHLIIMLQMCIRGTQEKPKTVFSSPTT